MKLNGKIKKRLLFKIILPATKLKITYVNFFYYFLNIKIEIIQQKKSFLLNLLSKPIKNSEQLKNI
jgi:hypothetical protein